MTEAPEARPLAAAMQRGGTLLLRAEDWLLAGWVALVAPLLGRLQTSTGPFDGGQPLAGLLRLAGVLGALACLSARRPPADAAAGPALLGRASIGPFVGGLLLVALSGVSALGLASWAVSGLCVAGAIGMLGVRLLAPPLPTSARRALVTPFILAAGGLFWSLISAVTGSVNQAGGLKEAVLSDPAAALPFLGFVAAFSAVYYAMLVYAPRQVAEREGGVVTWALRYALFVVGILFGLGWLTILGT